MGHRDVTDKISITGMDIELTLTPNLERIFNNASKDEDPMEKITTAIREWLTRKYVARRTLQKQLVAQKEDGKRIQQYQNKADATSDQFRRENKPRLSDYGFNVFDEEENDERGTEKSIRESTK